MDDPQIHGTIEETSDRKRLRPAESKTVGDGVAILIYERASEEEER